MAAHAHRALQGALDLFFSERLLLAFEAPIRHRRLPWYRRARRAARDAARTARRARAVYRSGTRAAPRPLQRLPCTLVGTPLHQPPSAHGAGQALARP